MHTATVFCRRLPSLAKRSIHVTPMADIMNSNVDCIAIDFIDNPIITHTKTIESFSALQLGRLRWERIGRQAVYALKDTGDNGTRDRLKVFLNGGLKAQAIRGHVYGAAFSSRRHSPAFQSYAQPPPQDRAGLPSGVNIV